MPYVVTHLHIVSCVQGNCGEKTSKDLGITREDQDNYAIRSYKAAQVCVLPELTWGWALVRVCWCHMFAQLAM